MQVKHNKIYYGVRSQMNDNMFRPFFWTRPSSGQNIVVEEEFTECNSVNTQSPKDYTGLISPISSEPWFHYPTNIHWTAQFVTIFFTWFSPSSSSYVPHLMSRYSPQHPTLQRLQSMSIPHCARPCSTRIHNNRYQTLWQQKKSRYWKHLLSDRDRSCKHIE